MAIFYKFCLIFCNGYTLFTVHVDFVGRLVCSVILLYMELSYTGSLDRLTRASEHVTVQISYACKTTAGYHCFYYIFEVYLIKLHCNECILFAVLVVFVGRLVCSVNLLYMELSYTGSLNWSTTASGHVTVQISLPVKLPGWQVFIIV